MTISKNQSHKIPTLAEEAHRRLEEMIILGKLRPGVRLSEQVLARELNIGRTPIREALQKLRESNLVGIFPRSGVFVTEVDFRSQLLVLEARMPLEIAMSVLAGRRATGAEREALRNCAAELRDAGARNDKLRILQLDALAKQLIKSACNNPYLANALTPIHSHSRRFYFSHMRHISDAIVALQSKVLSEIAQGEEAAIVSATEAFLHGIKAFTQNVLADELMNARETVGNRTEEAVS